MAAFAKTAEGMRSLRNPGGHFWPITGLSNGCGYQPA
jgi:hypothetical protein